jgi:hypothetical protein
LLIAHSLSAAARCDRLLSVPLVSWARASGARMRKVARRKAAVKR